MSRGNDDPPREHRRSRRHRDAYRDTYRDAYRGAYSTPEEEFPRSSRIYEPEPEPRRRGLNEDYYNPPPEEYNPQTHRRSRRGRSLRRSYERNEEPLEDSYFPPQPKPPRRAKTQSHGRHHRTYDESDFSDDEEPPTRPAKPGRSKSFLDKIGLGKASKNKEAARDRYDDTDRRRYDDRQDRHDRYSDSGKDRHRGRSSRRSYTREPSYSPPRRRNTTRAQSVNRPGHGAVGGLKRTITNANWQRAAGQAFKAGATAMYELRHDQSPLLGPKGVKIATAALGAGVMDAFTSEKHPPRTRSGGMRHRAISRVGEAALRHLVLGRDRGRGKY